MLFMNLLSLLLLLLLLFLSFFFPFLFWLCLFFGGFFFILAFCLLLLTLLNLFWSQMNFLFLLLSLIISFLLLLFHFVLNDVGPILKVESCGELEVELNCSTLVLSLENVEKLDINFRAIKSTVSFINFVWLSKLLKSFFKCRFCDIPVLNVTQVFLRPS